MFESKVIFGLLALFLDQYHSYPIVWHLVSEQTNNSVHQRLAGDCHTREHEP